MKNQTGHIDQATVVFSRWTRNAYAVFASLKTEVLIGHLALCISEGLVSKSKAVLSLSAQVLQLDTLSSDLLDAEISEQEIAFAVMPVESVVADAAACVNSRIII